MTAAPPPSSSAAGVTGFPEHLGELRRRLRELRESGVEESIDVSAELATDLETAYEELRVADEEVRAQQDRIAGLVERETFLRWQQDRLLALLPVPALVTDAAGLIRSVNAGAASLLDVRVARLLGKPLFVFFSVQDRPGLRTLLRREDGPREARRTATLTPRRGEPVLVDVAVTVREEGREVSWMLLDHAASRSDAAAELTLPEALARLTALPGRAQDQHDVLRAASTICLAALGPGLELSITRGSPLDPDVLSSTSRLAQQMDAAEMHAGQGPCVAAYVAREAVVTHDVRHDPRWPRLHDLVPEGVAAVVAIPIEVGERLVGVLNVYAAEPGAGSGLVETAELLAATLGAVLYEMELTDELNRLAADLDRALSSRATIEQAKGIVMAERRCGPADAFAHLVALSSTQERKLRDVATDLVERYADGRS